MNPTRRAPRTRNPTRGRIHARIVAELGARIVRGELAPGDVLPTEAALGGRLGVSRTSVREAMKVLAAKGLVRARTKTGTVVQPRGGWNMLDPDLLGWLSASGDPVPFLRDLFDVRRMIEPAAAGLAAERINAASAARIAAAYDAMAREARNVETAVARDRDFHIAILEATGNDILLALGRVIEAALIASFRITTGMPGALEHTLPQHRAVMEAILRRDPAGARLAMEALLVESERVLEHLRRPRSRQAARR